MYFSNHISRDGEGPRWLQESCSCGLTHLGAPTAAPDGAPDPAIPAPGDIEFSVCFASVIGQDAVKGGENAQGRGIKEIGKHYTEWFKLAVSLISTFMGESSHLRSVQLDWTTWSRLQ